LQGKKKEKKSCVPLMSGQGDKGRMPNRVSGADVLVSQAGVMS